MHKKWAFAIDPRQTDSIRWPRRGRAKSTRESKTEPRHRNTQVSIWTIDTQNEVHCFLSFFFLSCFTRSTTSLVHLLRFIFLLYGFKRKCIHLWQDGSNQSHMTPHATPLTLCIFSVKTLFFLLQGNPNLNGWKYRTFCPQLLKDAGKSVGVGSVEMSWTLSLFKSHFLHWS